MVRTDVEGEEINIFALGHRGDVPIVLVGESKLQLDRRRGGRDAAEQVMEQLAHKAAVVKDAYPDREIVQLLITHYAAGGTLSGGSARRYSGPKLRMVTARSQHSRMAADQFRRRSSTDCQ